MARSLVGRKSKGTNQSQPNIGSGKIHKILHHPLFPTSCNLLIVADIDGTTITGRNSKTIKPTSGSMYPSGKKVTRGRSLRSTVTSKNNSSKIHTHRYAMRKNRKKNQNSPLFDLPEKLNVFLKPTTVEYAKH